VCVCLCERERERECVCVCLSVNKQLSPFNGQKETDRNVYVLISLSLMQMYSCFTMDGIIETNLILYIIEYVSKAFQNCKFFYVIVK